MLTFEVADEKETFQYVIVKAFEVLVLKDEQSTYNEGLPSL